MSLKLMIMKRFLTPFLLFAATLSVAAQTAPSRGFKNPVLPGYYPDPSVCAVEDDFYMVNSSFQYFPGVPIHHSKDLIHWESIGYVLDRPSQLDLSKSGDSGGIFAPTIRYHDGTFYMVTTNITGGWNFYVTATDPAGPWSDPIWIEGRGIDPTLFFDDDGKAYLVYTGGTIKLYELDIETGERKSEVRDIWDGIGGSSPEAPHIYKKDGWYYLLIAEGGTEWSHMVTVARSRNIYGPYTPCPSNPILTHITKRASGGPIRATGHGDLVQASDGSWWMVFLAIRMQNGNHHLLGRETYLAPVDWPTGGWPSVNGDGTVYIDMDCPTLPQVTYPEGPATVDFSETELGDEWNWLYNPVEGNYSLTERPGWLRVKGTDLPLSSTGRSPSFVGRRQQHTDFTATTVLSTEGLKAGAKAGLTVFQDSKGHYDLAVERDGGRKVLKLKYYLSQIEHTEASVSLSGNTVALRVTGRPASYAFSYSTDGGKTFKDLGEVDSRYISTETLGGFTGVYVGLFAEGEGSYADFDSFTYEGQPYEQPRGYGF